MAHFVEPFSEEIYNLNYRFGEEDLEGTWHRVATTLAGVELDPAYWCDKFFELLKDFKFIPGGRILANAGTGLKNTVLLNCFVSSPTGYDIDSLESIQAELGRQMKILAGEGGYGVCANFMRPRGAYVQGAGVESPGAVKYLEIWDASSEVITAGSGRKLEHKGGKKKSRRGAQMVTLACWHPDVEEFITAKQTPGRLTRFNMSVLISDAFMQAVQIHGPWQLEFPDYEADMAKYKQQWDGDLDHWKALGGAVKVYKTFTDATELWDLIMTSTYNRNEPGVLFIDTINRMNNLQYCEHINATNPCLPAETLVLTDRGQVPIRDLIGKPFVGLVAGKPYPSTTQGFWKTGIKPVLKLTLDNGMTVRATDNHKFMVNGAWLPLGEAKIGDEFTLEDEQTTAKLVAIETQEAVPVYDCTIPGAHRFSAEGILVHNCGEQLLPPGGVCLLGSFNLTQFIDRDKNDFDYAKLKAWLPIAVRLLDNVNDVSSVPLPEQKENMQQKRRIGLGVMGYGSALMLLRLRYGSLEALAKTDQFMKFFQNEAYRASVALAWEKGVFPLFDKRYLDSPFIQRLEPEVQALIREHGIRNSHLLSVQPTGTSSILANNVSGGLEPIFLAEYVRTTVFPVPPEGLVVPAPINWNTNDPPLGWTWIQEGDERLLRRTFGGYTWKIDRNRGLLRETLIQDYAVRELKSLGLWDPEAEWASTTARLHISDHVSTLACFAAHIDSSISKTCNLPADYPYSDFKRLYQDAYHTGVIKGITTYREGTMTSVLAAPTTVIAPTTAPTRPEVLPCHIDLITMGPEKWVVLVGLLKDRPFEVFALKPKHIQITDKIKVGSLRKITKPDGYNTYHLETEYFTIEDLQRHFESPEEESLTRMISTALKHGTDINEIYKQLQKAKGTIVSFSKAIARSLAKYVTEISNRTCENCGDREGLMFQEGCVTCKSCGASKCG